jgi:hypothetical protein
MAEYCPFCKAVREMQVTETETRCAAPQRRVKTKSFHCEVCRRFVRSEDRPVAAAPN